MIYLNGLLVTPTIFPDHTSQVWKVGNLKKEDNAIVVWEYNSESEFIHLAQLKTLLDSYNISTSLELLYLPYGRQDKEVSNNTTFALTTFSNLLNSLNFKHIYINDPHSKKALELIYNSEDFYPTRLVNKVYHNNNIDLVCYPDKGALHKYMEIYSFPFVYGEKTRDQETGNIINYKLCGDVKDSNVLIIDDICDGGATFITLAESLYKNGAKNVNLFVTHGIFSKGVVPLFKANINNIYTSKGKILNSKYGVMYSDL